jgi:hypothetical protein
LDPAATILTMTEITEKKHKQETTENKNRVNRGNALNEPPPDRVADNVFQRRLTFWRKPKQYIKKKSESEREITSISESPSVLDVKVGCKKIEHKVEVRFKN